MNILMLLRGFASLFGGAMEMFTIDSWLDVMVGPDCWNYTAAELTPSKAAAAAYSTGGFANLSSPLAQVGSSRAWWVRRAALDDRPTPLSRPKPTSW